MKRYFKTIVLSLSPLRNYYRYRDYFQIYPIESDALYSEYAEHIPLYLEYSVDVPENISNIDLSVETLNKEKEILSLLTIFTSFHIFCYTGNEDRWGLMMPAISYAKLSEEQKKIWNNLLSSWTQAAVKTKYFIREIEIKHLSDCLEFQQMPLMAMSEGYFLRVREDKVIKKIVAVNGQEIVMQFPSTINQCFDAYYQLSTKHKQILTSSIYLACEGIDVQQKYKALGFLAIASALEGLTKLLQTSLPKQKQNGKIEYEKKKILFKQLMSQYYSDNDYLQNVYENLYNIRCGITHENELFLLDYGVTLDEDNLQPSEDWFNLMNLTMMFRTVVTNILTDTERKNWI